MLLMFLNYLPLVLGLKQVGVCPHLIMAAPMLGVAGMSQPLGKESWYPETPDGGRCLLCVISCFGVLGLNPFWRGKMQVPFFSCNIEEECLIKY